MVLALNNTLYEQGVIPSVTYSWSLVCSYLSPLPCFLFLLRLSLLSSCRAIFLPFTLMFFFSLFPPSPFPISLHSFSLLSPGPWLFSFLLELLGYLLPRDFFLAPLGHLCFVTDPPSADVAHHRAQHAPNKPSNPKAPQGTFLSALPSLTSYCGCQPPITLDILSSVLCPL